MTCCDQERPGEALDLEGSRELPPDAHPHPVRGDYRQWHEGGRDDGRSPGAGADELGPTTSAGGPHGGHRQEADRVALGGHRGAEQRPADPVAVGEQRDEGAGDEGGRPQVEPGAQQVADEQRREPRQEQPRAAGAGEGEQHDECDAAGEHCELERGDAAARPRGRQERGQRAGRIVDRDVAVRNLAVAERDAVRLVDADVAAQLVVLAGEEPDVQQPPADDEEGAGGRRPRKSLSRHAGRNEAHPGGTSLFRPTAHPCDREQLVVSVVAFILALASTLVLAAIVGWLFYWAAREDGREDDAVQRRLGIRRRTRLGPD